MMIAGCYCDFAWQETGLLELGSRQPQARPGHVFGHSGYGGKALMALLRCSVLNAGLMLTLSLTHMSPHSCLR